MGHLCNKNILLLVGGSIAAYKSAEIIRHLVKAGAQVRVAMTSASQQFITPLTLQTLSGKSVITDFFNAQQEEEIGHIRLADTADIVLVAPATADLIAKAASGIADSVVTAILLATKAPVVFVPAMNVNMWEHPITQRNVQTLKSYGVHFVDPDCGELACGWEGAGRLAEYKVIIDTLKSLLTPKTLIGMHILVTAGPTREPLDPVRFLSNRSTGKMGFALAETASLRGAEVSLITGPTSLEPPYAIEVHQVTTALEMQEKLSHLLLQKALEDKKKTFMPPSAQYLFMSAAVSDFRSQSFSATKLKSDKKTSIPLPLVPNPDILYEIGTKKLEIEATTGLPLKLIGFAAETGDLETLRQYAKEKLKRKNLDFIVGNLVEDSFENDTNRVLIIDSCGKEELIETSTKEEIAERIMERVFGN